MSGAMSSPDSRVETISRLAQWRIETFGPCSYRRSEPFKLGIWNWYMSVEKSRSMYIRLFPEPGRLSKEQPPLARFVLRVSSTGPTRRTCDSPGIHACDASSLATQVTILGALEALMSD